VSAIDAAGSGAGPAPARPAREFGLPLIVATLLTAMLEVLDMTIVNVSLPHMMGAFGATPDQIAWVLTSYMVSSAIVMPLTGYLSGRLGRRRLLRYAITGFVVSSALCGLAWSLEAMVVFRLAQGICGAPLVPLSQAILFTAFPREKRGQAMAIWSVGVMVAPVLGPTLGGYLTDEYGWRFIFYVNVPVGIFALMLAMSELQADELKPSRTDWGGLALLALSVGCLQFVLDQGHSRDWFDSRLIQVVSLASASTFVAFIMRGWNKPDNIIDLSLFRDRNFSCACIALLCFGLGMYGTVALVPVMLQSLLGYPATGAGFIMAPRALTSGFVMMLVGLVLLKRFDPRHLIMVGMVCSAVGTLVMTRYTLQVDAFWLIVPGVLQGIGMGLLFVPLSTLAFDRLPPQKADEASGQFSVFRTLGGSIGTAIAAQLYVHATQEHWTQLAGHVQPFNPAMTEWLAAQGLRPDDAMAIPRIGYEVARQSQMLGYIDSFMLIAISFVVLLPLALYMYPPMKRGSAAMAH
jgi:DHA2 family multidrug resistance protein